MSGPYLGRDLSNCGVGRLRVAINCGVVSVNEPARAPHFSLHRKAKANDKGHNLRKNAI